MHSCPECGQACYCHGDIDDCVVETEAYSAEHCYHDCQEGDDDFWDDEGDWQPDDDWDLGPDDEQGDSIDYGPDAEFIWVWCSSCRRTTDQVVMERGEGGGGPWVEVRCTGCFGGEQAGGGEAAGADVGGGQRGRRTALLTR